MIAERKSHLAIGLLTIIQQQNNSLEIHFGLGPRFQGQDYMLEAMKAVIQYFRQYLTFKSLDTFCDAEHIQAHQVLLRQGLKSLNGSMPILYCRSWGLKSAMSWFFNIGWIIMEKTK